MTMTACAMLDREFLEIRRRVLDIAASLDRIEACAGAADARRDPRFAALAGSMRVLTDGAGERATRVQMVFSLRYDEDWRDG